MRRLEFLIEPFEEGQPGRHVQAAVDAVAALGGSVDFGPFSSTCDVDDAEMPNLVAELLRAAFEHGATNVRLSVEAIDVAEERA